MKTILGTFLALGLLSSAASAQWCPPGAGYGHQMPHQFSKPEKKFLVKPTAEAPVEAPVAEPAPAPEPVPQK